MDTFLLFLKDWLLTMSIVFFFLMIAVSFHEFAHYMIAKAFKLNITEFKIGKNKFWYDKIHGNTHGNTHYQFSWLPFSGVVKIEQEMIEPKALLSVAVAGSLLNLLLALIGIPFYLFVSPLLAKGWIIANTACFLQLLFPYSADFKQAKLAIKYIKK